MAVELGQDPEQLVTVQTAIKLRTRVIPHVAVELRQMVKNVLTDVTRVRQRGLDRLPAEFYVVAASRGSTGVIFGVTVMSEGLFAKRAVVAFHRPVGELVHTQEVRLSEGFATYVTFVRLLSGVDAHVSDERRLEREGFTAVLAHFIFPLFPGHRCRTSPSAGAAVSSGLLFRFIHLGISVELVSVCLYVIRVLGAREFDLTVRTLCINVALSMCLQMKVQV